MSLTPLRTYRGIASLRPRDPIGAVLRIGKKAGGSAKYRNPVDRDMFYICEPKQDSTGDRPLHPAFARFNTAEKHNRKIVEAVLVHGTEADAFSYHLQAWRLPDHEEPPRGAGCKGDGVSATRFVDGEHRDIQCPDRRCEFQQARGKKGPPCKPLSRILFRPIWAEGSRLPTPLMLFETRAWNSAAYIRGLFHYIEEQAGHLGVRNPSLYGFPFQISLGEETSKKAGTRYPVVRMTPTTDVQTFLAQQQAIALPSTRPASMLDAEEHSHDKLEAAHRELADSPAGGGGDAP